MFMFSNIQDMLIVNTETCFTDPKLQYRLHKRRSAGSLLMERSMPDNSFDGWKFFVCLKRLLTKFCYLYILYDGMF